PWDADPSPTDPTAEAPTGARGWLDPDAPSGPVQANGDPMGWLVEARSALGGVQEQPARSLDRARLVLAADDAPADARILARWAAGRALQELGEPRRAADELTAAAVAAGSSGDTETQGHIDMSLAWALMAAGDTDG